MSDELINHIKNIESQNEEIIRLLKIIAGEEIKEETPEVDRGNLISFKSDVGVVYFIEDENIFKLTVENNETIINNLTSSDEALDYSTQELIARESLMRNHKIADSTVILSNQVKGKLPEVLKICIEQDVKNVYSPWSVMSELIRAPQQLMTLLKLDFYKTDEELIEKLFE